MSGVRFIAPVQRWFDEALTLHRTGQRDQARALYQRVLAAEPAHFGALHMHGAALLQDGKPDDARLWLQRAYTIDPTSADLNANLGLLELQAGDAVTAETHFRQSLAVTPRAAPALRGLARALLLQDRPAEALADFEAALAIAPASRAALIGKAMAQGGLGAFEAALAGCDAVLAQYPGDVEALALRGKALLSLERFAEVEATLGPAFAAGERGFQTPINLLSARQFACDWRDQDALWQALSPEKDAVFGQMFVSLAAPQADAATHAAWARAAGARWAAPRPAVLRPRHTGPIRLGYVSNDFREHAVAYVTAELFELHRRDQFQVTAIALNPAEPSALHQRLRAGFDDFIEVAGRSDADIADTIAAAGIDILIDMMGYTVGARPGALARRPAPVQMSYIGYPGSLGAHWMDYILADRTTIPAEHFGYFTEKVIWMPDTYQVNDRKRAIGAPLDRASQGLPATGFVYVCMNHTFKIQPAIFAIWMRLLAAVPGSVLWLVDDTPETTRNLLQSARQHGIDPSRLIFAPRAPLAAHLARLALADLFLDTLPYNAHATGSDALWAGVPVLTCLGGTFAGRVGASLLQAAGIADLVTTSLDAYEAQALDLARNPARLTAIRQRLATNRSTCALFDSPRFRDHLEAAYHLMWDRHCAGLPPAHIAVPATSSG